MTALVTTADVYAIFPSVNDQTVLQPAIDTADLIITESLQGLGLSTQRLTKIELFLAAHFAVITWERGGLTRQRIDTAEDFYQAWNNKDIGLAATRFGQQAVILDTTGTLAGMGTAKLKAQFRVVSRVNGRSGSVGTYDADGSNPPNGGVN